MSGSATIAKSTQEAAAPAGKDKDVISDDEILSKNEDPSPSANIHPLLLERTALRSEIAPLLGRTNPSAVDQLSAALEKFPDQVQWYVSRGMVNAKLEKFDQAIKDMTTAIELAETATATTEPAAEHETVCFAILNRAKAREDLGDLEGAVSDAKLALEQATASSETLKQTAISSGGVKKSLESDCRNAHALYQQKLKKQKEKESSKPKIVRHGGGVVIEDVTEEHAKISAKKAGIIAAVSIAKGRQQADVGKEFRSQFNEKVKAYEQEAKEKLTKEKKRNKKKKKKAKKAAESSETVAVAAEVAPVSALEEKEEKEEYKKLYKVETFPDPEDPSIMIERIHIPITYTENKNKTSDTPSAKIEKNGGVGGGGGGVGGSGSTTAKTPTPTPIGIDEMTKMEGIIPGLSVGAIDESKFDFLKRYNF